MLMNIKIKEMLLNEKTLKDLPAAELWELYISESLTSAVFTAVQVEVMRRIDK